MISTVGLIILLSAGTDAALRDVPVGECHGCEVTCFEDCSLKYSREIMQADLIQIPPQTQNKTDRNLTKIGQEYMDCLRADKCPCPKEEAKAAKGEKNGTTSFLQN